MPYNESFILNYILNSSCFAVCLCTGLCVSLSWLAYSGPGPGSVSPGVSQPLVSPDRPPARERDQGPDSWRLVSGQRQSDHLHFMIAGFCIYIIYLNVKYPFYDGQVVGRERMLFVINV